MKVTVYLGANMGDNPSFKKATIALGQWIAKNGHTLVYGGSKMGLMGVLGDTVLENGGQAHGIMPQFLKDREIAYEGLTSMTIVETMAERKTAMLEQGDFFIALPGGLGTLEEISEAIAAARVGKLDKPCVFFNLNGYYDAMKTMLDTMVTHDFLEAETAAKFLFTDDFSEIEAFVQSYEPPQLRRYR